jgi:hypothetical protein
MGESAGEELGDREDAPLAGGEQRGANRAAWSLIDL